MSVSLAKLRPWLLKRAHRLVYGRTDAEDLVQDVLAKYIQAFEDQPAPSEQQTMAWLATALKNAFILSRRKQSGALLRTTSEAVRDDPTASLLYQFISSHVAPPAWPIVVTFYPSEAGTDCSSVVASVAVHLMQRDKRVLVVDFDLQAPKVEGLLTDPRTSDRRRSTPGLVELLQSLTAVRPMPWKRCILSMQPLATKPELHVLSARTNGAASTRRADDLDFDQMFERHDLGRKLEALRSDWLANYDTALINSPSGTTAASGICVINLADVVVAASAPSRQCIEAMKSTCRRATTEHSRLPVDRRKLRIIPLLLQNPSNPVDFTALELAASELGEFFADWLPSTVSPTEALRQLSVSGLPQEHGRLASLIHRGWSMSVERREPEPPLPSDPPLSSTITDEELEAAMNTLSHRQRQVFEASARGLRYAEIARELGVKEGTVAKRIFDARKRIRAALLAMKSKPSDPT